MTMAEVVVGLVLGVVPLIVSAAEHYDDILGPIQRYRKFSSKVKRLSAEIEVERAIFLAECQILLGTVADRSLVAKMLNQHEHSFWNDKGLQASLNQKLGSLAPACEFLMSDIRLKLGELQEICKKLDIIETAPAVGEFVGSRAWRHRLKGKVKFSISELPLKTTMSGLRELNKSLVTLSGQVLRLDCPAPTSQIGLQQQLPRHDIPDVVKQSQIIRKSSQHLYKTLSGACTDHAEHTLQLQLDPVFKVSQADSLSSHVRFYFAMGRPAPKGQSHTMPFDFRNSNSHPSQKAENHIWFEVESVISSSGLPGHQPVLNFKDSCDPDFEICKEGGVCQHLADISPEADTQFSEGSFKILHQSSNYQHRLRPHTIQLRPSSDFVSLAISFQNSLSDIHGRIPQFRQLQLAKCLALSVLHFHSTPWLPKWLTSDEIYLLTEPNCNNHGQGLCSSPFIKVNLPETRNTKSPGSPCDESAHVTSEGLIPNTLLFRLGILLLELAYGQSFHQIRKSQCVLLSPENSVISDFLSARRLADHVGTYLGVDFAVIVRKCLRCDFGCGEDLENPHLQTRFFEDVIARLGDLEDGFRRLQQ